MALLKLRDESSLHLLVESPVVLPDEDLAFAKPVCLTVEEPLDLLGRLPELAEDNDLAGFLMLGI